MTVELDCRSYYSFLDAVGSPEELAEAAASAGVTSLALADRDGLYGAPEFFRACGEVGVKPLIGSRLTMANHTLLLLAKCNEGYRRLCHTITAAYRGRDKGDPLTTLPMLQPLAGYVVAILEGEESLKDYQTLFDRDLYLALTLHREEGDRAHAHAMQQLSRRTGVPLVAAGGVQYATREQGHLHDVLLCIKERLVLREAHAIRSGNTHRHLLSPMERELLYSDFPEALARAEAIAEECSVNLVFEQYRFPDFSLPEGELSAQSYLERICYERRTPCEQLRKELALIEKLDLAGYFLVVWDLVEFARSKNIPVQGRGSAANSLVAYTLGITPVDPIERNLYLGRFIHEGMTTVPDIDLDFASRRHPEWFDREDVIQYVYDKYGPDHVAMVATFITFQPKMAIREVGRVLELPEPTLDRLSKLARLGCETLIENKELQGDLPDHLWTLFWQLVLQIQNIPRHPSIHVGGMLITSCPVTDLVPLEPARIEGRVVCQWDKDRVDDAGLIKVDILGLGMLAVLREAVLLMAEPIDLDALPLDDPLVYQQIQNADTVGVFQVESRAQMQSLPRTRPANFQELAVQVAIIRPGPLQGGMVQPYIARKQGLQPVSYLHSSLKPFLEETLGVILFQEQVLQVATSIASFTPGEADELRRAMSRKRSEKAMERIHGRFLKGAAEKRIPKEIAEQVFRALEGFALYGFCKSHALSFAKITYHSAYLKAHYPAHFTAALLNNQPMGFYSRNTLLQQARRSGVEVRPVAINTSHARCHVEGGAIRLGFEQIDGVSYDFAKELQAGQPYRGIRELPGNRRQQEKLIEAGALDAFGLSRRELLWQLWLLDRDKRTPTPLFERSLAPPQLPRGGDWEKMLGEYRAMGLSTSAHPMALLRPKWPGAQSSEQVHRLADGTQVRTVGMVICRQKPPTAKGFAFLTLEDEHGFMNIVVRPDIYEQFRYCLREAPFLSVEGVMQVEGMVYNIVANRLTSAV